MTASDDKVGVRQLAAEILSKVDTRKAYTDILLDGSIKTKPLNERDRALLTEIVYGTLRWRGNIDGRLQPYLRQPLSETDPLIRNLLRLAMYQLLFLDKVPDYAAVNEAVELAKKWRGNRVGGFINGVLRNVLRQRDGQATRQSTQESVAKLAVANSHPQWLVEKWRAYFGSDEAIALMRANNEQAPLVVRANITRCARDVLLAKLAQHGIEAQPTRYSPVGFWLKSVAPIVHIPGFAEGYFQVQGESSQLVSYLLDPQPNQRILDACAAPGGKTTHIAELMQDRGAVVAIDRSETGVRKIVENSARLGLQSIDTVLGDASKNLPDTLAAAYDRVLVDAPCSGFGTLRSHPEIKWQRDQRDIDRLSQLQRQILGNVCNYLKPGGVLVYSTCTLMPEENEAVIEEFLAGHRKFELQAAADYLPAQAKSMVKEKYFLALPHRNGTDGFFAARLRKVN